jgi:phospholipase/lecithinase/hemolysin
MRSIPFLCLLCILSLPALGGPFTSVIVYGDSLSDNGNLYAATGNPASPPYFGGRFSNGPVAAEWLAPAVAPTVFNFAWGGATTGLGNYGDGGTPTSAGDFSLPGMMALFTETSASIAPLAPSSLFVVWGGPNDFLSPSPLDGGDPLKTADRAVADLMLLVSGIQNLGGQHILVPGMPDLGLTPYFIGLGQGAAGSALTDYFNMQLRNSLPSGVLFFDTAAFMRNIYANPSVYGFTNVTDACMQAACADPNTYLFWDDFHPTARTHMMISQALAQTAVPEPSTWLLVSLPLLALPVVGRASACAKLQFRRRHVTRTRCPNDT